ncbi:MAG: pilus assembly protein PilM, partial [Candidatus Omnitrophota bacterium]
MVRPMLERLLDEISRSITYYRSEFNSGEISELLLSGGGSKIKGFDDFLANQLNIKTSFLELPPDLARAGTLTKEYLDLEFDKSYLSLGAALGAYEKINFVPPEILLERKQVVQKMYVRLTMVFVICLLAISFMAAKIQLSSYQRQLDIMQSQRLLLEDLKRLKSKIEKGQAIVNKARAMEIPTTWVLKELSGIMPHNIQLSSLSLNQGSRELTFRGYVTSRSGPVESTLTDFMKALQESPLIKESDLKTLNMEGSRRSWEFEIVCELEPN